MVVFIDGPQLVGKSTLINYLNVYENFKIYKFNFSKYTKEFKIKSKKELKGFQIGKDLSMLYWLKSLTNDKDKLIVDRGILSTIYYSYILKRMNKNHLLTLFDELQTYKKFQFVFIIAKNNEKVINRMKEDGFDKLPKDCNQKALNFIKEECEKRNIKLKIFYNDFEKSILENGRNLKDLLYRGNK